MLETLVKLEEELAGFHAWALSGDALVAALDEGMPFRNQFDRFLLTLIHQAELQGIAKPKARPAPAWLRDRYRMWITDANQTVKRAIWLHADGEQTGGCDGLECECRADAREGVDDGGRRTITEGDGTREMWSAVAPGERGEVQRCFGDAPGGLGLEALER
jgi:hypothetical protein